MKRGMGDGHFFARKETHQKVEQVRGGFVARVALGREVSSKPRRAVPEVADPRHRTLHARVRGLGFRVEDRELSVGFEVDVARSVASCRRQKRATAGREMSWVT